MIKNLFASFFSFLKSFFKKLFEKASSPFTVSFGTIVGLYTTLVLYATKMIKHCCKSKKAEAYVDTGVKVLIAVVLGALLLGLLYALFNDTIMPTVQEKVEGLFNYAG